MTKSASKPTKLRAVTDLALRKSSDPASPLYQEWMHWSEGEVFIPPSHFMVERALERGIVKVVNDG